MSLRNELLTATSVSKLSSIYDTCLSHPAARGKLRRRWARTYADRLNALSKVAKPRATKKVATPATKKAVTRSRKPKTATV